MVLLSIRIGNKKGVVSNGIDHSHDLNRVGNVIHNVIVGKEDHRIWKVPKQPQPIQHQPFILRLLSYAHQP